MGLSDRLNTNIWWHGRSGLVLAKLKNQINIMFKYEDQPQLIIVHIAGNDLGKTGVGRLQGLIKQFFVWLWDKCPGTLVAWSQILPRTEWRYSKNAEAMNRARCRINSTVAKYVIMNGGCYLHYPDIKGNKTFLRDGTHLTPLGNEIFLNTIQGAIETFLFAFNIGSSYPY